MPEFNIETIKDLCGNGALRWTQHILIRLFQRNLSTDDVVAALLAGEIIELYPSDYPHPSCLVLGLSSQKQILHIVCGISKSELWLITAYSPNSNEWESDFKKRRTES